MVTRSYRAAAFFDVDKTLVDGYLIDGFTDYLADMRIVSRHLADRIREKYRRGATKIAKDSETSLGSTPEETEKFEHLVADFLGNIGNVISGISADQIRENAESFIKNLDYYMSKFVFTKPLVKLVRDKGYLPVIISGGGPAEVTREFAETLRISPEHVFSTGYEKKEGRLTGRFRTINARKKGDITRTFAHRHRIKLGQSAAFGDSLLDLEMLKIVGYPVLIRPTNNSLRNIAENPTGADPDVARKTPWLVCDDVSKVVKEVDRYLPNLRQN